jgi:Protein of unknown function (DUF2510)
MRLRTKKRDGNAEAAGAAGVEHADRPGAWYSDPYGKANERRWDGTRWTDDVRGEANADGLGRRDAVATEPTASSTVDAIPAVGPPSGDGIAATEPAGPTAPTATMEFTPPAASVPWPAPSANDAQAIPARICPSCSALSNVTGEFCPHCGAPFSGAQRRAGISTRVKVAAASLAALLVLGGAGVAVAIKLHHDSQVAAQHHRAAAAATARQQQAQAQHEAEISNRQGLESQLQTSITNDATQKADEGLLDNGPATSTTCTPLSGGSSQDLSQSTGTYSCLAAYQANSDGTSTGYSYTGDINFDTGMLTWHLGGN